MNNINTCVLAKSLQSWFCNPINCSLLGSSIHGILQARILEWVAISCSRGHGNIQIYLIICDLPSILHPCAFLPFPSEQLRHHIVAHKVLHSVDSAPTLASSCSSLILVQSVPITLGFFSVLLMCPILLATGPLHMLFHRMFSSFPIAAHLRVHFKACFGIQLCLFLFFFLGHPLWAPV